MIQVGIIEDNRPLRQGVQQYINSQEGITCHHDYNDVETYIQELNTGSVILDVLILDINLPGQSGLESIPQILNLAPDLRILMYSILDDSDRIFKALCAGASGYILKDTLMSKVVEAIENVYHGHAAMSPSIAKKVIDYFRPKSSQSTLSPKENQVVQCLVDGLSYKMIADKLMISGNTVNYHIRNIYRKLQVNSKGEVISKRLKGEI